MKTRLAAIPMPSQRPPASIADGHRSSCLDVPMAAPRGAEVGAWSHGSALWHRSAPRLRDWAQWWPTA